MQFTDVSVGDYVENGSKDLAKVVGVNAHTKMVKVEFVRSDLIPRIMWYYPTELSQYGSVDKSLYGYYRPPEPEQKKECECGTIAAYGDLCAPHWHQDYCPLYKAEK